MEETRFALASNLIKLRTRAGLTQAQLGEKLNYSDKTISKWERAEALPDVLVLKQIGELFHITIDDLLCAHNKWEKPQESKFKNFRHNYSVAAITMVAIAGIWTLAVLVFAIFWILGSLEWRIFAYAVPVSLIAFLVFHSMWGGGKYNLYIISALVLSIIATIYIALVQHHLWQLFLVFIPAEVVIVLSFRIKRRRK